MICKEIYNISIELQRKILETYSNRIGFKTRTQVTHSEGLMLRNVTHGSLAVIYI